MAEIRVSQLPVIAEIAAQVVRVSQVPVLVEIDQVMVCVSQVAILVEIEYVEPPHPVGSDAGGSRVQGATQPAAAGAPARTGGAGRAVSPRAAALASQLYSTLAASRATMASGTKLSGAIGAGGAALVASVVRTVATKVEVDWDNNGSYTDETAYVVSMRGSQQLTAPEQLLVGGRGQVASCSVTLSNHTARFSPQNSSGALYAYIAAGAAYLKPIKVTVTINATPYVLFTGVIRELNEAGITASAAGTVTLECRSRDELILQDKRSTTLADFITDSAALHTEDWHIINLLTRAGLTDGTDFVSQTYADAHPGAYPTIDPGIFPLQYVWLDDESVLDELWNLVAACCGWFYCDYAGVFHYHNITAVLPAALARQYSGIATIALDEGQVAGLQLRWPTGDLYNEIAVEVAPRGPGEVEELWSPDEPPVVQPNQTKTIWARLSAPLITQPALAWQAYTASGVELTSGVTVTATNYAQRVKLVLTNTNTSAAYFTAITLTGQPLVGGRTVEVEAISSQAFWSARTTRRRTIRGNVYIQHESQAATIAAYVLKRAELPLLTATVPDLARADVRLGWPVAIDYLDAVPVAQKIVGLVAGLSWTCDKTGFHQDATILETGSLFAGYDPIFILGTHKLGAAGALTAYLYY